MDLMDFAETMSLTGESKGVRIRGLDDTQAREVYHYGLFPNLLISRHPDCVMTHRFEPLGPGETKVECLWLFPPEAREHPTSTRRTPPSSGTSRTARTGSPVSRCTGAFARGASVKARSRGARTRATHDRPTCLAERL